MSAVWERLTLVAGLAPVPVATGWQRLFLEEADEPVRVAEIQRTFNTATGAPDVEQGRSWPTRRSLVARAYADEWDRVLTSLAALGTQITVSTTDPPRPLPPGVTLATETPASHRPHRRARLRRLLTTAVHAGGGPMDPRGGDIVNTDRWLDLADGCFSPAAEDGRTGVIVSTHFLPVLVEWLRADAVTAHRRRRMIRARIGLPPGDPDFAEQIAATATALTEAFRTEGLAAYRAGARVALALQDAIPVLPDRPWADLLFAEDGEVRPVAAGVTVPPLAEYPLTLADGTTARLERPPWTYGAILDPREAGAA